MQLYSGVLKKLLRSFPVLKCSLNGVTNTNDIFHSLTFLCVEIESNVIRKRKDFYERRK